MKIIEVSGDATTVGKQYGEATREEIRHHLELRPPTQRHGAWKRMLSTFLDVIRQNIPNVLEELEGIAKGANVPFEDIARLNIPACNDELLSVEGCTNIIFSDGPDGPIWGKNNDRPPSEMSRPVCGRVIRRGDSIPTVVFAFCGMVATLDAMNAEGVAIGYSSVGTRFQQSIHHIPVLLWGYEQILKSRTSQEFLNHMVKLPTRGKGYSIICVDRHGTALSIEVACPVMQVRHPINCHGHIHCVNCYQLSILANADQRGEVAKANAQKRWQWLDQKLDGNIEYDLEAMKEILRFSGDPSICCHDVVGGLSVTEYSIIGLPKDGRVLYTEDLPCKVEYKEICI